MRRTLRPLLLTAALGLAPWPALAESQSSDQNSNCSNGRCTRVDTRRYEQGGYHWGWQSHERWDERQRGYRPPRPYYSYQGYYYEAPPRRRRGRDQDDD